ncbi:MAG: carotenoid biosynthesis protein [Actinomycetales bacterium]
MSVRVYSGPRAGRAPSRAVRPDPVVAVVLASLGVLAQIAYPLVSGTALRAVTFASVVLFFLASLTHAWLTRGAVWGLAVLVVAAGGGFAVELLGTRTGFPFGEYSYAGTLGPQLLGVPLLVGLAWAMLAYPSLVVARRLVGARWPWAVPLVGGFALAGWDLALDPQMVDAGHWTWAHPTPALPGIPGIPVTNYLGWLAVSVVMVGVLSLLAPARRAAVGVPAGVYLWTWASSVVGNLVFFDRPAVAAWVGVAMGLVAVPLVASLWNHRP